MPGKPKQPCSKTPLQDRALLSSPKKVSRLLVLAALALAIGVHLTVFFHRGGLWRDEVSTANFASMRTPSELLEGMSFNTLPIALPLALFSAGKVFGPWVTSESILRPICFLVGIATPMLWSVFPVRSRRIDTFVLVLLQGASVTIAQWGDTLRAYGLGVLALNLLFFSLLRLAFKDDRVNRSLVSLFFLLAIHSCYQAWPLSVILMLAFAAFFLFSDGGYRRWHTAAFLLGVVMIGGLTLAPYRGLLARIAEVHKIVRVPELDAFGVMFRFVASLIQSEVVFVAAALVLLGSAALSGLRMAQEPVPELRNKSRPKATNSVLLSVAGVTAISGVFFYCLQISLAKYVPYPWHFVLLLSFLSFPLSVALPLVVQRALHRNLVAALLLLIYVAQLPQSMSTLEKRFTNLPSIAKHLQGQANVSDMILVTPWESGISFKHHYQGKAEWQTAPPISDNSTNRFDLAAQWMAKPNFPGLTEEQQARIAEVLRNGHTVWVVGQLSVANSASELLFLPPAPTNEWGWRNGPYYEVWSRNLHTLLARNATHATVVEEAMGKASDYQPYEYAGLYKFWRQADQATP